MGGEQMIGRILVCVSLLLTLGLHQDRQIVKLKDIQGSMSPDSVHDWAVKAKAWFEKSRVLFGLIEADKWSYRNDRLIETHRKHLATEIRILDGLCGEKGGASQFEDHPYSLILMEADYDGLLSFQDQMARLEYLESLNLSQGHMSTELFTKLEDQGSDGIELERDIFKHRYALTFWYEQAAGVPTW